MVALFFESDANLTMIFMRIHNIEPDAVSELKKLAYGFASRNIKHFYENHGLVLAETRFLALCAYWDFYQKHPKMYIHDEIPLDFFIEETIEKGISNKTKSRFSVASIGDTIIAA